MDRDTEMKIRGNAQLNPSGFGLAGGRTGCVLVHGFTGTPVEMRLLGEFLSQRGVRVEAPLLPGHGTRPEDLNRVRWQDWVLSAQEALASLGQDRRLLFLGGLSMGALVALHLAREYPDLGGLLLFSPAFKPSHPLAAFLPLARHVVKQWPKDADEQGDLVEPEATLRIWHYDTWPTSGATEMLRLARTVWCDLEAVRVPALLFCSTRDATIDLGAVREGFRRLGSEDKELVVLHNSGHVLTVDAERESVFARASGFISGHVPAVAPEGAPGAE